VHALRLREIGERLGGICHTSAFAWHARILLQAKKMDQRDHADRQRHGAELLMVLVQVFKKNIMRERDGKEWCKDGLQGMAGPFS
jgi:hypothetical protein